jgi:hypothetical protein
MPEILLRISLSILNYACAPEDAEPAMNSCDRENWAQNEAKFALRHMSHININ